MGSKQEVLNHYLTRYMTRLNGGFCILSGNLLILLALQDSNTSSIDMFYMDKIVFDKICTNIYTNR
ncbi:Uncharacterised protein [Yersinia pseudotuberculosis]|nr:Uncharacterised protein [Yersinia pseudotuberculosis]